MTTLKPKKAVRKWGKLPAQITLRLSKELQEFYYANKCGDALRKHLAELKAQADKEGADNEQ